MVEVAELQPEEQPADGSQDGDDSVVPYQKGVLSMIVSYHLEPMEIGIGEKKDKT